MSRSFLFVPGDSEKKLTKAADCDADALILDLEDSVAASERARAREQIAAFLAEPVRADCWVRVNPLDSDDIRDDLEAIVCAAPHGIVLPKACGASDIARLDALLDACEAESGDCAGVTRVLPIATETPAALFRLHEYADCSSRLYGLTWGAEDLSAALGASASRDGAGRWLPPYEMARSLCLMAAAAAGLAAIDTVYTDFRDTHGLQEYAHAARRDGFTGMLAIHPAQIETINDAFRPSADEIARARRIVALFAEQPGSGVLNLDGEMIDRPHYLQAQRILEIAGRTGAS